MNRQDEKGCLIGGYSFISLMTIFPYAVGKIVMGEYVDLYPILLVFAIITLLFVIWLYVDAEHKLENTEKELNTRISKLDDELRTTKSCLLEETWKNNRLAKESDKNKKTIQELEELLKIRLPFSRVAKMYADAHAIIFNEDITLMLRRHNQQSTIQINKERKKEYLELCAKYKKLEYQYSFLISKYFSEVRPQLQNEILFLQFAETYTTKQYIELLNNRIKRYNKERNDAVDKYNKIHWLLQSSTPFKSSAELIARIDSAMYDYISDELRNKSNPANTTADKIEKEFKEEYIKWRTLYEELYAKYQFLCETFPDLKLYIDDEESLIALNDIYSIHDFTDETDRVANYLSKDEWLELTCTQRNQLALDRYIRQNKSDAIIGLEYEMYVAYRLRSNGFKTIPHGILNGVNDLGRDILAWDEDSNVKEVYIIQCKLRSKDNVIHENVICQLYGTAKEYELENEGTIVVPVICTNVSLSDTAKKFADVLQIYQLHKPMKEFPRIKCNINSNGDKIYHLPFDQQYWRTQIKNDGECYAWTVREAEDMGFRRAMRHNPYMNQ